MKATGRTLVALVITLLAPGFATADLAAKPDAYTENDRFREKLEYNRKTLVDAYKEVGKKNPAWDAAAIKFLDSAARHFGSFGFGPLHQGDSPTRAELIELGQAVAKLGCDDPMVLYCYAAFLIDSDRIDEGKPVLQQAYKGLLESKYPADRIFYATNRMLKATEELKERLAISNELDKARVKLLSMKFVNSAHRRAVAQGIWEEFPATPASKRLAFFEQMRKNPQADQWIVNLFGGRHFIKAAWAARGGGWAGEVKAEGWRGFEANLEKARESLTLAWKLAPNLPEAPTEMITVSMGQSGEEIRTWFERAVEAQFDYRPAYGTLRYALLPRWHGSHEEILALGIECYRTGRYDTGVPYELVESLERIRDDGGGDMSLWDKPEMYEMIRDVMVQYAAKLKEKSKPHAWYLSYAAALANRNSKHEESRKFLEQIDDKIVESTYSNLRLNPKLSVSESYLFTGPFGERFQKVFDLQKAEKHEQAAAAMQKIIDELPKDDKGLMIARHHLHVSQDVLKLAAGEWVDLTPRADLTPWGTFAGVWSSPKEGELMGIADPRGLIALPGIAASMPPRYEFSAECEIRRMREIESPNAGLIINFTGWQSAYPGVWVYPSDKKLFTRGKEDKWHDIDCGDKFKLTVQVMDDQATVLLDGKEVAQFRGVGRANAKRTGIGLTGMYQLPDAAVVFREIKVRKLKKEPEAGEEK